jgi:hypothetical protein
MVSVIPGSQTNPDENHAFATFHTLICNIEHPCLKQHSNSFTVHELTLVLLMKLRLLLSGFPGILPVQSYIGSSSSYVTTPNGIIVYTDQKHKGSVITCNGKKQTIHLN